MIGHSEPGASRGMVEGASGNKSVDEQDDTYPTSESSSTRVGEGKPPLDGAAKEARRERTSSPWFCSHSSLF